MICVKRIVISTWENIRNKPNNGLGVGCCHIRKKTVVATGVSLYVKRMLHFYKVDLNVTLNNSEYVKKYETRNTKY